MSEMQFRDTPVVIPAPVMKFGWRLIVLTVRVILEFIGWMTVSIMVVGTAIQLAHGSSSMFLDINMLMAGFAIWVAIRGQIERRVVKFVNG